MSLPTLEFLEADSQRTSPGPLDLAWARDALLPMSIREGRLSRSAHGMASQGVTTRYENEEPSRKGLGCGCANVALSLLLDEMSSFLMTFAR